MSRSIKVKGASMLPPGLKRRRANSKALTAALEDTLSATASESFEDHAIDHSMEVIMDDYHDLNTAEDDDPVATRSIHEQSDPYDLQETNAQELQELSDSADYQDRAPPENEIPVIGLDEDNFVDTDLFELPRAALAIHSTTDIPVVSPGPDSVPTPSISTATFETPAAASATPPSALPATMLPLSRPSRHPFPQGDLSQPVTSKFQGTPITSAELAMGIWCEINAESRASFSGLHSVLLAFSNSSELTSMLPSSLGTVRAHLKASIPQLTLRSQAIPLNPAKVPTKSATQRLAEENGDDSTRASTALITGPFEDLFFFDPIEMFTRIASSTIMHKAHRGLAEFVDSPHEFWHSKAWASSIRATSGVFLHYAIGQGSRYAAFRADVPRLSQSREPLGSSMTHLVPIFPSDFVMFSCDKTGCACLMQHRIHYGRVLGIGKDYRSTRMPIISEGEPVVHVQRIMGHPSFDLPIPIATHSSVSPPADIHELFLIDGLESYVPPSHVELCTDQIYMHYGYQSSVQPSEMPPAYVTYKYFIRRLLRIFQSGFIVMPLSQSAPLRGELELQTFTRQGLIDKFDIKQGNRAALKQVLSLPLLMFIDGFGLYQNMHRSLVGVYLLLASLTAQERTRRNNVFPLTLGPHGSNFDDVVKAIGPRLYDLDGGIHVFLDGDAMSTLLCPFIFAFIGDMPQQQHNSGMQQQNATRGCRSCEVTIQQRGDLNFDIIGQGRYHHEVQRIRTQIAQTPRAGAKKRIANDRGMHPDAPALQSFTPALDVILSRPTDPAHSEFGGVTRLLHHLLINDILTKAALLQYGRALQSFPFPPGWARLQNPIHHLGSYILSEHARWSIIAPILMRVWLRDDHLQPLCRAAAQLRCSDHIAKIERLCKHSWSESGATGSWSFPDPVAAYIVSVFADVAKSNMALMGSSLTTTERLDLNRDVLAARRGLQDLNNVASEAARINPRSRSVTPARSRGTTPVGLMPAVGTESASRPDTIRSKQLDADNARPNIHVGLHWPAVAAEYGLPSLLNVLICEENHKQFKKEIKSTNKIRPERDMLQRISLYISLRLLLDGAYAHELPGLTGQLRGLRITCPTIFKPILPKSEQVVASAITGVVADDEEDSLGGLFADEAHLNPRVLGHISGKYCYEELGLPVRTKHLDAYFRTQLTQAYETDYHRSNVTTFGSGPISYYTKLSYDEVSSERHIVLHQADYIKYHGSTVGRIKNIFTLENIVLRSFLDCLQFWQIDYTWYLSGAMRPTHHQWLTIPYAPTQYYMSTGESSSGEGSFFARCGLCQLDTLKRVQVYDDNDCRNSRGQDKGGKVSEMAVEAAERDGGGAERSVFDSQTVVQ